MHNLFRMRGQNMKKDHVEGQSSTQSLKHGYFSVKRTAVRKCRQEHRQAINDKQEKRTFLLNLLWRHKFNNYFSISINILSLVLFLRHMNSRTCRYEFSNQLSDLAPSLSPRSRLKHRHFCITFLGKYSHIIIT